MEGTRTRSEAQGLANNIANFKFIISIVIWYDILYQTNITSKEFQTEGIDITMAANSMGKTKNLLTSWRCDGEIEEKLCDAKEIGESLGIAAEFKNENRPERLRRTTQTYPQNNADEPIIDAKQRYTGNNVWRFQTY